MDIDYPGGSAVFQVGAYWDGNHWQPVLQLPAKNMKATAPEALTSLTDVWIGISNRDALVTQAAAAMDKLLFMQGAFASYPTRPVLSAIVYSEFRQRSLETELSFLQTLNTNSRTNAAALAAQASQLQMTIASKLSAKKLALQDKNDLLIAQLSLELDALSQTIQNTLARQQQAVATAELATNAASRLSNEIASALTSSFLNSDPKLRL